jgi:hypothetical protein
MRYSMKPREPSCRGASTKLATKWQGARDSGAMWIGVGERACCAWSKMMTCSWCRRERAVVAVVNGAGGVVGEAEDDDDDDDDDDGEEEETVTLGFLPALLPPPRLGLPSFRARRFAA